MNEELKKEFEAIGLIYKNEIDDKIVFTPNFQNDVLFDSGNTFDELVFDKESKTFYVWEELNWLEKNYSEMSLDYAKKVIALLERI